MKKSASGNVGPLDGDSLGAVCKDRLKQEVDAPSPTLGKAIGDSRPILKGKNSRTIERGGLALPRYKMRLHIPPSQSLETSATTHVQKNSLAVKGE